MKIRKIVYQHQTTTRLDSRQDELLMIIMFQPVQLSNLGLQEVLTQNQLQAHHPGCGSKLLQIGKFCHNCGLDLAQTAPGGPPCKRPSSALSFGDFKKKKEADRSSKFEKKNDRKSQKKEVAKVQVGLVCDKSETGDLTKVKGRTIPILLNANADAASLLSTSVEKHSRHFKQFNPYQDYVILYSDLSVVKYLPGTNTPFTLEKYKEDLLKPYSKIYFWLCEKKHFENANDDTGSNEDEELEKPSIDIGCSGSTTKTTAPTRSRSTGKVVSWSSTATISSPSITVPGNVVGDVDTAKPSGLHQCPTCLSHFPYMEIEEHADACAESWVDPIGAMPLSIEIPSEDEENENKKEPNEREEQETDMEGIKNAVDNLKTVLGSTVSNRVSIRRSSAFQDYLVARRKKWFKPKAILKVIFIGEPAVDDGGPKREFFTETLNHVRCTLIDNDGIPYPDMRALSNDEFKAAGELIAASIIQGGPAPSFLADTVYEYIVDGMASIETKNWVSLVKDSTLKESIEKITDCTTDKQLRDLLNEDTMLEKLQIVGYRGVPSKETLQSSLDITKSLVIAGISKTLSAIDQMVAGLAFCGGLFLEYVKTHQKLMKPLFTIKGAAKFQPTSDLLLDDMKVDYSEDGSNSKNAEINVYKYFSDYVMDLSVSQDGLPKLYKFITGSDRFTPLGMEKTITMRFKHGCQAACKCRPTASTCDPSITLPAHYQDAAQFEEAMNSALDEGFGFGLL